MSRTLRQAVYFACSGSLDSLVRKSYDTISNRVPKLVFNLSYSYVYRLDLLRYQQYEAEG